MQYYRPPSSPPPNTIPRKPRNSYIVNCMYSYTYVWPITGRPFWYYPTRVETGAVSGFKWTGKWIFRRWVFNSFDPKLIDQVASYPVPIPY